MKKTLALIAVLIVSLVPAFAQDTPSNDGQEVQIASESGVVTIASKGQDVRNVLFDLFTQSKKSFVLEPNVRFVLYLALSGVQFDEALEIVCHTAGLKYEVTNGIYYLSKGDVASAVKPVPEVAPKPKGKVSDQDLLKKVTTRMAKSDIRVVFAEFAKQTDVVIEVDKKVPAYKVDAFLIGTSLKYALDVVTRAAGLEVERTDNMTLLIKVKS